MFKNYQILEFQKFCLFVFASYVIGVQQRYGYILLIYFTIILHVVGICALAKLT